MKQVEVEKLTNFCNKVIIQNNDATRGLCCYFEYKNDQYYASMIFDIHTGPEFAVFPALDKSVSSWNSLYSTSNIKETNKLNFRFELYKFLETKYYNNYKQRRKADINSFINY